MMDSFAPRHEAQGTAFYADNIDATVTEHIRVDEASIETLPLGVVVGGPQAAQRLKEHKFYGITKNFGALCAVAYILTQPTGWVVWSGFVVFYVFHILSMSLSYHRYFTHRAFETSLPMRYALGILAQLGVFGSLRIWCADHRRHHAATDRAGDAHSPFVDGKGRSLTKWGGLAHSHLGWVFDGCTTDMSVYGKSFIDDPVMTFCHNTRYFWYGMSAIVLPVLWGWTFGGPNAILGTVLVAGFLRLVLGLHAIATVNSFGHRFGYEHFKEAHSAKNNWLIALYTLGEGYHSNHHVYPNAASTQMAWYEIDLTGYLITAMEKVGLVWNVRRIPQSAKAKVKAASVLKAT